MAWPFPIHDGVHHLYGPLSIHHANDNPGGRTLKAFTDLVGLIVLRSGHHTWYHISKAQGKKRVAELEYRKNNYVLDDSLAHVLKGWYPWIEFNWGSPFAILKYSIVNAQRRVGLLIYEEPEGEGHTVYPKHIAADPEYERDEMTPALVKAHLTSPLYRQYQKGMARMGSQSQRFLIYILLAVIGVLLLFYLRMTGMI